MEENIYIASKQLQDKGGDAAVDADQYVHAGQNHVGCAGDLKEEGGRVHERRDGPPARRHRDSFREASQREKKKKE